MSKDGRRFIWKPGDVRKVVEPHVYADTAAGAIQYLRDDSNINLVDAQAEPDPQVEGVWLVRHPRNPEGERASIVYLAGYKDPFGRVREHNDFETVEVR